MCVSRSVSLYSFDPPLVKAQCPPLRVNQVNQTLRLFVWRTKKREGRKSMEAISSIHGVMTVTRLTVIYYIEAERGLWGFSLNVKIII